MKDSSNTDLLSGVALFAGLDDEDYLLLDEFFMRRSYPGGHVLFEEGERVKELSIIISGSVDVLLPDSSGEVQRFSELKLASFGPGEYFGEYSLLDLRPASASAVVRSNAELLQITGVNLQKVLNEHCRIAKAFYYNLALVLIDRLRQQNQELDLFTHC